MGWFTPTEGAAVGVVIVFVLLVFLKRFDWREIAQATWRAVFKAGTTTAFILFLVVTGFIYSHTLTFFGLPQIVGGALADAGLQPWQLYFALLPLLLVLGCFLDSLTMQVITVPFLLPLLIQLNVDLIAFGVFVVLLVEIGTMTPPFGIHLFILQGVTKSSYQDAVLGALPFSIIWLFLVVGLILFPDFTDGDMAAFPTPFSSNAANVVRSHRSRITAACRARNGCGIGPAGQDSPGLESATQLTGTILVIVDARDSTK